MIEPEEGRGEGDGRWVGGWVEPARIKFYRFFGKELNTI